MGPREAAVCTALIADGSMAVVGKRFGVTRERIRQIVARAEERHGFIRPDKALQNQRAA
jgi:DNA-directed RNA polymerase sigma subunit (sigma70/sigma32)